ncbi:MAG: hypothetical protein WC342_06860 [Methanoregula sp.]|jgi:hypothetical protein
MNSLANSKPEEEGNLHPEIRTLVIQVAVMQEKFQDYCNGPKIRMY